MKPSDPISSIFQRWDKEKQKSRKLARNTKYFITYQVIVCWVGIAYSLAINGINLLRPIDAHTAAINKTMSLIGIFITLVSIVVLTRLHRGVKRHVRRSQSLDKDITKFSPLSQASISVLKPICDSIAERLRVYDREIHFLRPKSSNELSPSVVETRDNRILMVIPPNFLGYLQVKPASAKAMLAHEYGHIAQGDTNLWLSSSTFAEVAFDVYFPYYRNLLVAGIIAFIFAISAAISKQLTVLSISFFIFILGLQGLFSIGWLYYFVYRMRRFRRRSEELADLAAWIYVTSEDGSSEPLEACFSEPRSGRPTQEDCQTSFGFFGSTSARKHMPSIHPTNQQRLQKISQYTSALQNGRTKIKFTSTFSFSILIPIAVVLAAILAAFLFPIFKKANISAKKTLEIAHVKQISVGLINYMDDNDEVFPPLSTQAEFEARLSPYMNDPKLWIPVNPNEGRFNFNGALATQAETKEFVGILKHRKDIQDPADTIQFYGQYSWPDGSLVIGFADGQAKSLPKGKWSGYWNRPIPPGTLSNELWQYKIENLLP